MDRYELTIKQVVGLEGVKEPFTSLYTPQLGINFYAFLTKKGGDTVLNDEEAIFRVDEKLRSLHGFGLLRPEIHKVVIEFEDLAQGDFQGVSINLDKTNLGGQK